MANFANTIVGEQYLVTVGDGNTTVEAFTMPSLINASRSVSFTQNVESDEIPDLQNLSNAAVMVRRVRSVDIKIDGSGSIHSSDVYQYIQWAAGTDRLVRNCKITQIGNGAVGGWTITAPMVLTNFQVTADNKKSAQASMTLELAGVYTLAKNP